MRTLLIDNYDSFTFNLFHLLGEVNGDEPIVVRNDELTWEELDALRVDNIVISPGPGRPEHERDVGVSLDALLRAEVPVLGVCLGHQALAHVSGGAIRHAPEVMHGRTSPIHHDGRGLFAGVPQGFAAVRYHSLVVGVVPAALRVTAWTPDQVVMGLEHRTRPLWGVQFHPESICTEHGAHADAQLPRPDARAATVPGARAATHAAGRPPASASTTARSSTGATPRPRSSRSTATASTPCGSTARARSPASRASRSWALPTARSARSCATTSRRARSRSSARAGRSSRARTSSTTASASSRACAPMRPELPFDFTCGFAGYLGYELKADLGGALVHRSPLPDAALVFCDRLIAFDHERRRVHLLALADATARPPPTHGWRRPSARSKGSSAPAPPPPRRARCRSPHARVATPTWPTSPPACTRSSRARPTRSA